MFTPSSIYSVLAPYMLFVWSLLVGALLAGYFYYMKKENEYFSKNHIKSLKTYFPFVGNTFGMLTQKEHFLGLSERMYKNFPGEKYFGFRNFNQPLVVIKDLDLIKQLTIKDFDHFVDHAQQIDSDVDPIFGNAIISLKGQKWRDMRATLSPAFTSSKMRVMFEFVTECGDQMAKYLLEETKKQNKEYLELELKDLFTRYTNDVIATSAFGIKVNSLEEKDNIFFKMGQTFTTMTGKQMLKFIGSITFPKLMKMLFSGVFDPKVAVFFKNFINDAMETREEKNIFRPDMIHLLMEAKKGILKHEETESDIDKVAGFATVEESEVGKQTNKREWTNDELIAQAAIFFFAGFETSSSILVFLMYEIAKHPDIQKKLQIEIDEVAEKNDGNLKYDDLLHMKYMDMVVSENLRYRPPPALDRKCVKAYTLPPSNENDSFGGKINVGDGIWIPAYGIHHDPKYYKNPEVFDPERFSDENKHEINPLAYMPFGVGPRNCIGSRFALMELKSIVFHLLRHFDVITIEKTPKEIVFANSFSFGVKGGLHLGFRPRESGWTRLPAH